MSMIHFSQKSKKKKSKPTAKQRELAASWEKIINSHKPKKLIISEKQDFVYSLPIPPGRETKYYPSLNTGAGNAFKKENPVYTGDKVKGIGTLHKSNAVPIFTDEEAKDQASMRR